MADRWGLDGSEYDKWDPHVSTPKYAKNAPIQLREGGIRTAVAALQEGGASHWASSVCSTEKASYAGYHLAARCSPATRRKQRGLAGVAALA